MHEAHGGGSGYLGIVEEPVCLPSVHVSADEDYKTADSPADGESKKQREHKPVYDLDPLRTIHGA